MSKVLTPSPRCRRAAAVSQDRLNVPSFKSSNFFPQDHSFFKVTAEEKVELLKRGRHRDVHDSSSVNSDFFAGFALIIFSSPFFVCVAALGLQL